MSYMDPDRIDRIRSAMASAGLDALLCCAPQNVLMLTQYWPVLGSSIALITKESIALLVPEDEQGIAASSSADLVQSFITASLQRLTTAQDEIFPALRNLCSSLGGVCGKVGIEIGAHFVPPPYVSVHTYGVSLLDALQRCLPHATFSPADELLQSLSARKTAFELNVLRKACEIPARAFDSGSQLLVPGLTEYEAAQCIQPSLFTSSRAEPDARYGGQVWCMSGANSAQAYFAYARSRNGRLEPDDLVLVHCNSYYNGMWTDITRTFVLGDAPSEKQRTLYEAVFQARSAALAAIRPGVQASQVDRAARREMQAAGLGDAFKHQTGHGVGFGPISHNNYPRVHPASDDVLEEGMTFNIEPGAYIEGFGGIRQCDLIAVTANGCEVLTPFLDKPEELFLRTLVHRKVDRTA
jgi:Xaa-Pro aminopeptidase